MDKEKPNRKELERLYNKDRMSTIEIAKKYGVNSSTIFKWLKAEGINVRDLSLASRNRYGNKVPSKDSLRKIQREMTVKEMKEHYSVSLSTVYTWLEKHNIDRNRFVRCASWKNLEFFLQQAALFLQTHPQYDELPGSRVLNREGFSSLNTAIMKYHCKFPVFRERFNEYLARQMKSEEGSLLEKYIGNLDS